MDYDMVLMGNPYGVGMGISNGLTSSFYRWENFYGLGIINSQISFQSKNFSVLGIF